MSQRLAPLNALRAFEVSARHLSFTKAAEELSVTPAAISQQVKSLEAYFGVQLFRRMTRALALTEAGRLVLPTLNHGFVKISEADRMLRNLTLDNVLSVTVPPTFGARWLVPRLHRFRAHAPEFEIRIDSSYAVIDFNQESIDLALRYGTGENPGLVSECLMSECVVPVCHPDLIQGEYALEKPEDLKHHTLLHNQWDPNSTSSTNWRMWVNAAGCRIINADLGPRFDNSSLTLEAAALGQGVALVDYALAMDDLKKGRLVQPFSGKFTRSTNFCYYLVYPEAKKKLKKVKAFREWILDEIENQF